MRALFPPANLPADARRTFRFHLTYALLDAACGGILLNAPFVALRAIEGQNWQLPIRDFLAGIGMLPALYLGSWMASRRKMPFVFIPGLLACLSALVMAAMTLAGSAFWMLTLFGVGAMLDAMIRPAITAVLRENYPVAQRGHVTAVVRQWSSLAFVAVNLSAAYFLGLADKSSVGVVAASQMAFATLLGFVGYLCFRLIPTKAPPADGRPAMRLAIFENIREAAGVVLHDGRYRRFLTGCLVEAFFYMLYMPAIMALLSKTLGFDYLWCALLMHGIPTITAFLTTGLLGWWFDRSNPWISWAWVRFAFGLDALLLAATPAAAIILPPLVFVLPILGRLLRGGVQGGWFVLWWQIGVTHFAPPGEDTSRYAGIMVFINGLAKIAAASAGMALLSLQFRPVTLLWMGGAGVIATGVYSLCQAVRERKEHRPETFAAFESQFQK